MRKLPALKLNETRLAGALLACSINSAALAAGGHYFVDDAALLDPKECQFEGWVEREARAGHSLTHAGAACRVGSFELGVAAERSRIDGQLITTGAPQLKWATSFGDKVSVGAVASINFQNVSPRYSGTSFTVPVSIRWTESVQTHLNVGRDFNNREPSRLRAGVGIEWEVASHWSLLGERFQQDETNAVRVGVRWEPSAAISVDLSRTRQLQPGRPGWWTLGMSWAFERRRARANPLRPTRVSSPA